MFFPCMSHSQNRGFPIANSIREGSEVWFVVSSLQRVVFADIISDFVRRTCQTVRYHRTIGSEIDNGRQVVYSLDECGHCDV